MFTMLVSIFIYLASLFVLAVLSVIIGFYVYKDSKKRRMNPLLWTVIGALLNIPGLIAYLIARKIYFSKKCPSCLADTPAKAKFCSSCGVELDSVRPRLGLVAKTIIDICIALVAVYILARIGMLIAAVYYSYQGGM